MFVSIQVLLVEDIYSKLIVVIKSLAVCSQVNIAKILADFSYCIVLPGVHSTTCTYTQRRNLAAVDLAVVKRTAKQS